MPTISSETRGAFLISVTPFDEAGQIDWESLDRVTDFYLGKGADGLTILGMMGEATKLTQPEAVAVAERVIRRAGEVPVIVGVSAPGLAAIGELGARVMDLGAAGVMVAPPSGLRTDTQICTYFGEVAMTLGGTVPLVLQDFPLNTGVQISDEALGRMIDGLPSLIMLKHEDWPGLLKVSRIRRAEREGRRRISILCGNGGSFLVEEIERGADGAMTGFAWPEMMVDLCRLVPAGETERAQDLFDAYLPLVRYELQPGLGLAVRKFALAKRGAIASPALRPPGARLDAQTAAEVDRLIARQERRLAELG